MPKITLRVPLEQPTLTQTKMNLKLAKQVKKEPRKARDLGLLFVQPMKCALLLQNIKFYHTENETTLTTRYKFSLKCLRKYGNFS